MQNLILPFRLSFDPKDLKEIIDCVFTMFYTGRKLLSFIKPSTGLSIFLLVSAQKYASFQHLPSIDSFAEHLQFSSYRKFSCPYFFLRY